MKKNIFLNGKWSFFSFSRGEGEKLKVYESDYPTDKWLEGEVPGTVQGDLLRLCKLPDPFIGIRTVNKYLWVEKKEWWYKRSFNLPSSFKGKEIFLQFEGLDTYVTIYLNGKRIAMHENMFIPFEINIFRFIKINKENILAIKFDIPLEVIKEKDKRRVMETRDKKIFSDKYIIQAYSRKANFSYGGDMTQRMATVGIWRSVKLVGYEKARIINSYVATKIKSDKKASILLSVEIEKFSSQELPLKLRIQIRGHAKKIDREFPFFLKIKKGIFKTNITIDTPRFWWPNNVGKQSLYNLKIELICEGECLDICQDKFGIREVRLLQEPDKVEGGKTFTFSINGINVFAKGANWVPPTPLIYPVPKERYRKLIQEAKDAHFNMLRVSGYGVYPDEEFYRLCDEAGIMIWQDFAFSNRPFPDDDKDFVSECRNECKTIVKKLRNHPCIVLWCGNSELQVSVYSVGLPFYHPEVWGIWGEKIFHEVFPKICKELDPMRPYWPGSPFGGEHPNSSQEGDVHSYTIYNKGKIISSKKKGYFKGWERLPITFKNISYRRYAQKDKDEYTNNCAKFYSEFGSKGMPCISTLENIMRKKNLWPIRGRVWNYYWQYGSSKDIMKNKKKFELLNSEFGKAKNIEDYIFYSQLSQASCLKFTIEHFRSRSFSCSGALFWQFNDIWPCITYSIVDYYLKRKIAYYWVKKAFSPLHLTFIEENDKASISVYLINDLIKSLEGVFSIRYQSFEGEIFWEEKERIKIPCNKSLKLKDVMADKLKYGDKKKAFLYAQLKINKNIVSDNYYFFSLERELKFPKPKVELKLKKQISKNMFLISLSTDKYAHIVFFELKGYEADFSDNYFDIPPGGEKIIKVTGKNLDFKDFFKLLKVKNYH